MKQMTQGTIRGYVVTISILDEPKVRSVEGFGLTPKKALADAKSQLTDEERMFSFLNIDEPRKVTATFTVSGWTYED